MCAFSSKMLVKRVHLIAFYLKCMKSWHFRWNAWKKDPYHLFSFLYWSTFRNSENLQGFMFRKNSTEWKSLVTRISWASVDQCRFHLFWNLIQFPGLTPHFYRGNLSGPLNRRTRGHGRKVARWIDAAERGAEAPGEPVTWLRGRVIIYSCYLLSLFLSPSLFLSIFNSK